jgi:hypothetical protein
VSGSCSGDCNSSARAQVIATHGVVNVTAQDVAFTKVGGGRDMRVGADSAKAEVATVDEVTVREAEIQIDRDGVQVSLRALVLETGQSCAM